MAGLGQPFLEGGHAAGDAVAGFGVGREKNPPVSGARGGSGLTAA